MQVIFYVLPSLLNQCRFLDERVHSDASRGQAGGPVRGPRELQPGPHQQPRLQPPPGPARAVPGLFVQNLQKKLIEF